MAAFENTRALTEGRTFGAAVIGAYHTVRAAVSAWNDARITRKALNKLTLRELDDLGLVPGDIEDIAQGTYRR